MSKKIPKRPDLRSPKALDWLWNAYHRQKAEINELRVQNELHRCRLRKFGEALIDIKSTTIKADPHTVFWEKGGDS